MRPENVLLLCILVFVVCSAAFFVALVGCGGGAVTTPPPPAGQKIQHIVIIFQENRTPDNLFHGLPNADIANSGVNSLGQTIPLTPIPLANDYDLSHSHSAFVAMYDGGKMDGTDKIAVGCKAGVIAKRSTENTHGTLFSAAAGPPLPSTFREFAGAPFDLRSFFLDLNQHPEKLPEALKGIQARFGSSSKAQSHPPSPSSAK